MDNLFFHLEAQITTLLTQFETLKQDYVLLNKKKNSLQIKYDMAIAKLEEMVTRLKSLEPTL